MIEPHTKAHVLPIVEFARQQGLLLVHAWHGGSRDAISAHVTPQLGELRLGGVGIISMYTDS
ncbi:MAG: hypothetical protein AAF581_22990 [Planctomycetota bacterium]